MYGGGASLSPRMQLIQNQIWSFSEQTVLRTNCVFGPILFRTNSGFGQTVKAALLCGPIVILDEVGVISDKLI